jgi:hypothetical protein
MAKDPLVEKQIQDGARLLDGLRDAGLDVHLAFWYYFPDPEYWRFVIATDAVESRGPRAVYHDIFEVERMMPPDFSISWRQISAVSLRDRRVRAIDKLLAKYPRDRVTRLDRTFPDGVYFEDAYVYADRFSPLARTEHHVAGSPSDAPDPDRHARAGRPRPRRRPPA